MLPLGTKDSTQVANDALTLANTLKPFSPLERLAKSARHRRQPVRQVRQRARRPGCCAELARAAATATVAYADELAKKGEPKDVRAELVRAQEIANLFDLKDLRDAIAQKIRVQAEAQAQQAQIEQCLKDLKAALDSDNDSAVKTAKIKLATSYLQYDGNLVAAAKYLDKSEYTYAKAVLGAVAFLDRPALTTPQQLIDTAKGLAGLADTLQNRARVNVALVGIRMVDV